MAPMGKTRLAIGVVMVSLVAIAIGYVIASAVLTFRDMGFGSEIDFFYVAKNYLALRACLLYTSPSPRDLSTSRMPSSA